MYLAYVVSVLNCKNLINVNCIVTGLSVNSSKPIHTLFTGLVSSF